MTIQDELRGEVEAVLAEYNTGPVTFWLLDNTDDSGLERSSASRTDHRVEHAVCDGKLHALADEGPRTERSVTVAASALPRTPGRGDTVEIDGTEYAITECVPHPAGGDPLAYDVRTVL